MRLAPAARVVVAPGGRRGAARLRGARPRRVGIRPPGLPGVGAGRPGRPRVRPDPRRPVAGPRLDRARRERLVGARPVVHRGPASGAGRGDLDRTGRAGDRPARGAARVPAPTGIHAPRGGAHGHRVGDRARRLRAVRQRQPGRRPRADPRLHRVPAQAAGTAVRRRGPAAAGRRTPSRSCCRTGGSAAGTASSGTPTGSATGSPRCWRSTSTARSSRPARAGGRGPAGAPRTSWTASGPEPRPRGRTPTRCTRRAVRRPRAARPHRRAAGAPGGRARARRRRPAPRIHGGRLRAEHQRLGPAPRPSRRRTDAGARRAPRAGRSRRHRPPALLRLRHEAAPARGPGRHRGRRGRAAVFEPRHTTHGFRYVQVDGPPVEDVTAVVVHSDLTETGWFRCSDDRLNALHAAAVWSFRGNACDVPTDCPQRERSGFSGDWQVYVATAARTHDVAGFSDKWLRDLAADQWPDGRIPVDLPQPGGRRARGQPLRRRHGGLGRVGRRRGVRAVGTVARLRRRADPRTPVPVDDPLGRLRRRPRPRRTATPPAAPPTRPARAVPLGHRRPLRRVARTRRDPRPRPRPPTTASSRPPTSPAPPSCCRASRACSVAATTPTATRGSPPASGTPGSASTSPRRAHRHPGRPRPRARLRTSSPRTSAQAVADRLATLVAEADHHVGTGFLPTGTAAARPRRQRPPRHSPTGSCSPPASRPGWR